MTGKGLKAMELFLRTDGDDNRGTRIVPGSSLSAPTLPGVLTIALIVALGLSLHRSCRMFSK